MAGAEQQTPIPEEECVNNGFDLVSEKGEGLPEFDEALKKELLNEAQKKLIESGMSLEQAQGTLDNFFPESESRTFYADPLISVSDVLTEYKSVYGEGLDIEQVSQAIDSVYSGYKAAMGKYVEEFDQIAQDAHQGAIDCHLDVNREILKDYQRRIREYCENENIPLSVMNDLIEYLQLTQDAVYNGDYEFVRDNFEEVKQLMFNVINDIGQRGMGVYSTKFTDEQLTYLHGIGVALVKASLDDLTDKKDQ